MASMSPIISTRELGQVLGSVTLLDVRYQMGGPSGPEEYAAGHVPGALYVDLDTDLAAPSGAGGRHPLPSAEIFQEAMRRAGVRDDRPVVVYDDWAARAAGRCWWLLRYHGHRDVRVLDGGWSAWVADGGAVSTGASDVEPGDFTVSIAGGGQTRVVVADDVLDVDVLVDARAAERYRGESEPVDPVAGHIPGAVNVPTSRNLTVDGRFRSAEELRAVYAEVGFVAAQNGPKNGPKNGPENGQSVAVYCGSGVTATHDLLAMEIAGIHAALYAGSWSGWITDPRRPVVRDARPG